jgi:hypothetical protein
MHYAMRAYGGVTSPLAGGEWSASHLSLFTPSTYWIGGWVDLGAGLDDVKKRKFLILSGLELQPLSHPARSHSLSRLLSVLAVDF